MDDSALQRAASVADKLFVVAVTDPQKTSPNEKKDMSIQDKSRWDEVEAMLEEQVKANAAADKDNPPTDANFWTD